jgi:hypothetical protein
MRKIMASLAAAAVASVLLTSSVFASPWVQQSTTCLYSNKLLPGHIYINQNSGKVRCIAD